MQSSERKKIFYVRIDTQLNSEEYLGYQCYKDSGDFIYSKWSRLETLTFKETEIVQRFNIDDAEEI